MRRILTLFLINLFLVFLTFSNTLQKVRVYTDRNFYKLYLIFSSKIDLQKFVKDTKHDLLVVKIPFKNRYEAEYYSVLLKASNGVITLKVKNPKLNLNRAWYVKGYRTLVIVIPFRKEGGKYTVVIDPGHGGKDTGAIYYGVKEKDINLSIAKKLYAYLERDGRFKVYLTRSGDYFVSLADRQKFTAKVGADLFISIHANANPYKPYLHGVEFYILSDKGIYRKFIDLAVHPQKAKEFLNREIAKDGKLRREVLKTTLQITQEEGEDLALSLKKAWCKYMAKYIPCHGIFKRNFAVLKVPGVPTVLVEVGYMTNRRELKVLVNNYYQWFIASTLYLGILDYLHLSVPRKK